MARARRGGDRGRHRAVRRLLGRARAGQGAAESTRACTWSRARVCPCRSTPTGRPGEYFAGVRYRAWQPWSALHPTIPVHAPLAFDVVDIESARQPRRCDVPRRPPGRPGVRPSADQRQRGRGAAREPVRAARPHRRPPRRAGAASTRAGGRPARTIRARSTCGGFRPREASMSRAPRLRRRRSPSRRCRSAPGERRATTRSSAPTARCGRRGRAWPAVAVDLTPAELQRVDGEITALPGRRRRHLRRPRETGAQPWQLDPMPLVMDAATWARLEVGLAQRAELLNAMLADLYGEQRLLRDGVLPAAVVFGHAGLHAPDRPRPAAATRSRWCSRRPTSGATPTGEWRVLADRAQAPSGLGYAMENRRVISRVLPELYRRGRPAPAWSRTSAALRSALLQSAPAGADRPARRRAVAGHALRDGVRPGVPREHPGLPAGAGRATWSSATAGCG